MVVASAQKLKQEPETTTLAKIEKTQVLQLRPSFFKTPEQANNTPNETASKQRKHDRRNHRVSDSAITRVHQ